MPVDAYGNTIRLTKTYVVNSLLTYLGAPLDNYTFYDDRAYSMKHCCLHYRGIQHLSLQQWTFQDEGGNILVDYFRCPYCGNVYIQRDFM